MRKIIVAVVGLLSLTALIGVRPAASEGELGIYGGGAKLGDYGTLDPRNRPLYGARVGYWIGPVVGLEVSGQRMSTHAKLDESQDISLEALRGNVLFALPAGRLRPFITGGGGVERTHVEGFERKNDFGWNAGGGLRLLVARNFDIRADARYVRVNAEDFGGHQNNGEATLGLNFLFGGQHIERIAVAPVPPNVNCSTTLSTALPGQTVALHATANDPPENPLTYDWTTNSGKVIGNGADATLDLTGVNAPSTATVTVRVTDRKGLTATSDCVVAVEQPAPPPPAAQAVSCLASGFPRNLARLTNVDKACLDDVVQRLNADPRARVVVIGYADSHERAADQIAQQRADAVQDYLSQAGIDRSRITTRAMGASNPVEAGPGLQAQASNRRVQVWFVPEGATIPE